VYVFKAHRQLYHKLDPLKTSDEGPQHIQLYFYETDDSVAHRLKRSPGLDRYVIEIFKCMFL
jgi:hypothetical protein